MKQLLLLEHYTGTWAYNVQRSPKSVEYKPRPFWHPFPRCFALYSNEYWNVFIFSYNYCLYHTSFRRMQIFWMSMPKKNIICNHELLNRCIVQDCSNFKFELNVMKVVFFSQIILNSSNNLFRLPTWTCKIRQRLKARACVCEYFVSLTKNTARFLYRQKKSSCSLMNSSIISNVFCSSRVSSVVVSCTARHHFNVHKVVILIAITTITIFVHGLLIPSK